MKYVNRDLKGTFEYIKKQRIFEIIKTIILFAMAMGIFIIGYVTVGTKKNLWTVFAILAMLPACKSFVGVVMFARYKSLTKDIYELYLSKAGSINCLYENVLTTSKKSYYIPVLACCDNTVIAYMPTSKSIECREIKEHLETVLKNGGHKGVVVKIFDKEDDFLNRLVQMNDNLDNSDNISNQGIYTTIKAVSL